MALIAFVEHFLLQVARNVGPFLFVPLVLERFWPASARRRGLRQYGLDMAWYVTNRFVHPMVSVVVDNAFRIAAIGLAMLIAHRTQMPTGVELLRGLPTWLKYVLSVLLADFVAYWCHRAQHMPGLWRFHAIHHAPTHLDWASSYRKHPLDMALPFLQDQVFALFGFVPEEAFVPFMLFDMTLTALQHANVPWTFGPLRYVLSSPIAHRWHHSADVATYDKNFGQTLMIWDLAFGTFYMPATAPTRLGLPALERKSFLQQWVDPFLPRNAGNAANVAPERAPLHSAPTLAVARVSTRPPALSVRPGALSD